MPATLVLTRPSFLQGVCEETRSSLRCTSPTSRESIPLQHLHPLIQQPDAQPLWGVLPHMYMYQPLPLELPSLQYPIPYPLVLKYFTDNPKQTRPPEQNYFIDRFLRQRLYCLLDFYKMHVPNRCIISNEFYYKVHVIEFKVLMSLLYTVRAFIVISNGSPSTCSSAVQPFPEGVTPPLPDPNRSPSFHFHYLFSLQISTAGQTDTFRTCP